MEIEIGAICKNCTGVDTCNKMCILHCGKSLIDFINRVDVTETKIGDYDKTDRYSSKNDLVVYGHKLFDLECPTYLLTHISVALDASNKFLNAYEKNVVQIANIYCKHMKMSDEETTSITDKIKGINKNRLFVLPFKPHTNCNIDLEESGKNDKKQDAKINYVKWVTNKETHKIECDIGFTLTNKIATVKNVQINVKDYITKFRLSQMDIQAKSKKHDKNLIKITDYGIFKPIYVHDAIGGIAIDGTYLYYVINGDTHIIGYWDSNDKMKVITNINTKAFNKVMDNIEYIRNHKKYMAPYLLYESNNIEVK